MLDFMKPVTFKTSRPLWRLFDCLRHLGLRKGWSYWQLQNCAIKDPTFVLRVADQLEMLAECQNEPAATNTKQMVDMLRDRYRKYTAQFN